MKRTFLLTIFFITLVTFISGCTGVQTTISPTDQPSQVIELTETPPPTLIIPSPAPTETTRPTASQVPSQTIIPQATQTATSNTTGSQGNDFIIADHTVVDQLEKIPDQYIEAASQLKLLFRHASVGFNLDNGLNCLANNKPNRPHFCDAGLTPDQVIFNPKYNRSNWIFEFHQPPPRQNPGWNNKTQLFIDRINGLPSGEMYDIAGYKLGYVDAIPGSDLAKKFFNNDPNDQLPSIEDLEQIEASHPEMKLMYMTLALARSVGSPELASFDEQMRAYVRSQNKILFDIADIESHLPDGTPCYDNHGAGIEAVCDEYTDEKEAGHLNALGSLRVAKALWWLMARVSGWDGVTTQ